jgi:hypothetical protein
MSTHQAYLEWIDQKILEHQTEIARLTVARSVLEDMPGLRLQGQVERAKPLKKKRQPSRAESSTVRLSIINVLKQFGTQGAKPIAIINLLGIGPGKDERRPIYNAISRMEKDGALVKAVDGTYGLPYPLQGSVPASQ